MRLTLGQIRDDKMFQRALNICRDSDRFPAWVNAAEESLLLYGRWWGTIKVAQFCVTESCLVFPREVASIEQVAVDGVGIPIYTSFYQFFNTLTRVENCSGGCSSDNCGSSGSCGLGAIYGSCGHVQMRDRGQAVSFAVTRGSNKTIRSYPSNAGDVGKKIIFQGRDSNNIWVRTMIDGIMQDGEEVTLALPFVDTTTVWGPGNPVGVIKEETLDVVRVYSFNTDTSAEKLLATYQASETHPIYRAFNIPNFGAIPRSQCCVNDDGERIVTVTAIAKLAHVPVVNDNDWLLFQNKGAYLSGMLAMKAKEEGNADLQNFHFFGTQANARNGRGVLRVVNRNGAIPLLQAELRSNTSDRTDANLAVEFDNRVPRQLLGFI